MSPTCTPTVPNISTLATKMNQIKFNKRTCPTVQFSLLNLHTHKKNIHLVTPSRGLPPLQKNFIFFLNFLYNYLFYAKQPKCIVINTLVNHAWVSFRISAKKFEIEKQKMGISDYFLTEKDGKTAKSLPKGGLFSRKRNFTVHRVYLIHKIHCL